VIRVLTLDPPFKLDPLVDAPVDLDTSIPEDIADRLSCHLNVRDQRVGLLDEDHLWWGAGIYRELRRRRSAVSFEVLLFVS